jgi:hypothetical protein
MIGEYFVPKWVQGRDVIGGNEARSVEDLEASGMTSACSSKCTPERNVTY